MIKKMDGGFPLPANAPTMGAGASAQNLKSPFTIAPESGKAPIGATSGNPALDEKFKEVAQMYEKQFLREMMKSMRSTVSESGLVKVNQGERIFREKLDEEYVEKWGDKGGIGLSDMIYEQLVFHYGSKMPVPKPQGPMELNEKSNFTLKKGISPSSTAGAQTLEFTRKEAASNNPEKIVAPWGGLLKQKLDLGPNETFLEMWHDNGLKSKFVMKGSVESLTVGQKLQEGEGLGYLSPETKNFFWNVSM